MKQEKTKKTVKESKTTKSFEKFRQKLMKMRQEIIQTVQRKQTQELPEKEVGDEADAATSNQERELLFELSDNERIVLDAIEAALRKIEHSKYGHCESCMKKIARERLEVMPYARYCVSCQTRFETPKL